MSTLVLRHKEYSAYLPKLCLYRLSRFGFLAKAFDHYTWAQFENALHWRLDKEERHQCISQKGYSGTKLGFMAKYRTTKICAVTDYTSLIVQRLHHEYGVSINMNEFRTIIYVL